MSDQSELWEHVPKGFDLSQDICESRHRGADTSVLSNDVTASYHGGNENSVTAHGKILSHKQRQLNHVLRAIRCLGAATCQEIEEFLSLPHESVSARMTEAKKLGLIEQVGTRKTRSNSPAGVWKVST